MPILEATWRDIRYAARFLTRTPVFTAVAVLSLALGLALVGSTVAAVNAYLIRALPYPGGERLYNIIYTRQGQGGPRGVSGFDWASLSDVIELAAGSDPDVFYLTDAGYTEPTPGSWVGPGFTDALGIRPAAGRAFTSADFAGSGENVVLISHRLWRERFGSDPNILGRRFRAYSADQGGGIESFSIIGVLPADFWHTSPYTDLLAPIRSPVVPSVLRLRAGVPPAAAESRLTAAITAAAQSVPPGWRIQLQSVHRQYVAGVRPILVAVTAAAGIVLVIICANLTFLVLLRATRRQKEVALRLAIGARQRDVVRLLIAEACVICGSAVVVGIGLTWVLLRSLAPLIEERLGRSAPGGAGALAIDPAVLALVGGLGLVVAAALSLTPLLASRRGGPGDVLRREGKSGSESRSSRRARSVLIALELAGSLALLVGCGLMIRTVIRMVNTDLGFTTTSVVRAHLALPAHTYSDASSLDAFYLRLIDDLRETPERAPAAVANFPPFFEPPLRHVEVEADRQSGLDASVIGVGGDYFATLGIPLVEGRGFTRSDRLGSEPVAIVSEAMAQRLAPDGHVLGRRIRTIEEQSMPAPLGAWRSIVGVMRDVRQTFTDAHQRDVYLPLLQVPNRFASVFLKTTRSEWMTDLRTLVSRIDPDVSIGADPPLDVAAAALLAGPRFLTSLLTAFALFTALLAVLGVYGVIAYAVEQREREIAIRVALGASSRSVIGMFVKQGAVVLAAGLALGIAGAGAVGQVLQTQLYGVRSVDVPTLGAMCLLLASAGLFATWWPARRAARQDPMQALKEE